MNENKMSKNQDNLNKRQNNTERHRKCQKYGIMSRIHMSKMWRRQRNVKHYENIEKDIKSCIKKYQKDVTRYQKCIKISKERRCQ